MQDRGINVFEDGTPMKFGKKELGNTNSIINTKNMIKEKIDYKLKSLEALFLLTAEEFIRKKLDLAEKILILEMEVKSIRKTLEGKVQNNSFDCIACTGINRDNIATDLGDCFEISTVHLKDTRIREILLMHQLRCVANEVKVDLVEWNGSREINGKLNIIINTLSQMIWSKVGGTTCQRKK